MIPVKTPPREVVLCWQCERDLYGMLQHDATRCPFCNAPLNPPSHWLKKKREDVFSAEMLIDRVGRHLVQRWDLVLPHVEYEGIREAIVIIARAQQEIRRVAEAVRR
jgi:hypothetical protein